MAYETLDALLVDLDAEANRKDVRVHVTRAVADGFGLTGVQTLRVEGPNGHAVVVWQEGGGDFHLEIGDFTTAAWWRQGLKQATLPQVIVDLADGRFDIVNHRVFVSLDSGSRVELSDRL